MGEPVRVPGGRDVRGTLDGAGDACIVACPPHPQYGGSRSDSRLRAVSDALAVREIACLRFDYGPWDRGNGERSDALSAIGWATERFDAVGLFGYSFGGAVALLAAAEADVDAVSALAPVARLADDLDVVAALADIEAPVQVLYGERDTTADWEPVVERARDLTYAVEPISGDHFFVGRGDTIGGLVADFLDDRLG